MDTEYIKVILASDLVNLVALTIHPSRCMVKDVAVEVPVPENTIPDLIIPSHIVVPRCTGRKIDRLLQYNLIPKV